MIDGHSRDLGKALKILSIKPHIIRRPQSGYDLPIFNEAGGIAEVIFMCLVQSKTLPKHLKD